MNDKMFLEVSTVHFSSSALVETMNIFIAPGLAAVCGLSYRKRKAVPQDGITAGNTAQQLENIR